jgi:hypothetical protein
VNVTDCPKVDGSNEDTTDVDVACWFTTCDNAGEVLPAKFALPPPRALMDCVPAASVEVVNFAFPLLSVLEPTRTLAMLLPSFSIARSGLASPLKSPTTTALVTAPTTETGGGDWAKAVAAKNKKIARMKR